MNNPVAAALLDERFLLLELLGRGSMGTVYRAFDRTEQRLVALKVPSEERLAGPGHPLSAEFEAWSRLLHPNIAQAYAMGLARSGPIAAGTPYLVLEHVDGRPAHRVLRPGRVAPEVAEALAHQVLCALDHIHAASLVHRDLKPGNVLVEALPRTRPWVRLIDFGLAVRSGEARRTGTFSGSLPYVAPEALLGLALDGRCDLYSLGVMLYQLTTGELPAPRGGAEAILRWHLAGPPADPSRIRPRLPRAFCRFVRSLTAKDRDQRPSSALEAIRLLGERRPGLRQRGDPATDPADRPGSLPEGGDTGVRLALDAARLGAVRHFRLPAPLAAAEAVVRDVAVWTQVRGLPLFRVAPGREGLGRLALRLLVERRDAAREAVRRYDLERWLPLQFVGGQPLLDLSPGSLLRGRALTVPPPAAVRGIADFLLDCALERVIVLCVEPSVVPDAWLRQVLDELRAAFVGLAGFRPGGGGLLVLTRDGERRPAVRAGELGRRAAQRRSTPRIASM